MKPNLIGSRLYTQIVYPLLAASIAVGVVATLIAIYFLGDLTSQWAEQAAEESARSIVLRYDAHVTEMERIAAHAASSPKLRNAAATEDPVHLANQLGSENVALDYHALMLVDGRGRIAAVEGTLAAGVGEKPFGDDIAAAESGTGMYRVGGRDLVVAWKRLDTPVRGGPYTLVACHVLDSEFLLNLGVGRDSAACLHTADGRLVTSAFGERLPAEQVKTLKASIANPGPLLTSVLNDAKARRAPKSRALEIDDVAFEARALELSPNAAGGPHGYVITMVSQSATQRAGRTTVNFLTMWSVAAIVSLVGLGGWVAHRVSDPLVALAAGARRIAEGDFETQVQVRGANEVAELAQTFNQMTESLRERSESLTKKVLELATLYDMSRALGSTLDLDELLRSVLDSALRIFDLDLGYVALHDRETAETTIRAIQGIDTNTLDQSVRSSMSDWVVREGRPLIFNPDAGAKSQVDSVTGARAALCVPLVSQDGVVGSITIGSSDAEYRFGSEDVRLLATIANHVTIAIGNIELFTSLQEAYLATVRSLAAAVDAKDSYTRGHSDRVATYSTLIAERMALSHDQRIALEMAAYLHDIGKIGVKEEILLKPGKLDDDEMTQMRHHPLIGANILKPVAFPWAITPVVRHHHEAWDGSGYPAGLKGEEIPLLARILTVADSFEAMTADRPYRRGRSTEEALDELRACSGAQFDPRIVSVFVEVIREFEESGEPVRGAIDEDSSPDESRAIFAAMMDGVFASFRRLGGPRLASNIESELDQYFVSGRMPFRISRGRLVFTNEVAGATFEDIEQMRAALRQADILMARVSGATLVEHFYVDALGGFSARMRELAGSLGFYEGN